MARTPKPWWRKDRKAWYVTIDGTRHNLGPDRDRALQRFHELMAQPRQERVPADSVAAIIDAFLEWTLQHRAIRTYEWYQERVQRFIDSIPNLTVAQIKPFHVQQWVDAHPNWSSTYTRGCITAVQRAFRWAQKLGYIDRNPLQFIEKPRAETRQQVISAERYRMMLKEIDDSEFHDLITVAWETGARPQELLRVEARHVDLKHSRWVIPKEEAKVKSRPRIVYLSKKALAITKRNMLRHPVGPIFRNTAGRPWRPYAVNCRFSRLKAKLGERYCLYTFRHSFATRLLERGVDALTVAILLGHQDPSMLARVYQHLGHNPEHLLKQLRNTAG